jgi:hypothetical protein
MSFQILLSLSTHCLLSKIGRTIAPRTDGPTRVSNALSFSVAAQLRSAYLWLIGARAKASPNADIWDLRRKWPQLRQSLKKQITTKTYCFEPLQRAADATGSAYSWSAQDALVLRCTLSPLIGAFHLYKLDCLVTQTHPRYF